MSDCGPLPYYHGNECRSVAGDRLCRFRRSCSFYQESKQLCNHEMQALNECPYILMHIWKDNNKFLDEHLPE